MPTNMIIFKSPKYSYFQICNVHNTKVICWICTWLKSIFQLESNKHHVKTRKIKKYTAQMKKQNKQSRIAGKRNHFLTDRIIPF